MEARAELARKEEEMKAAREAAGSSNAANEVSITLLMCVETPRWGDGL